MKRKQQSPIWPYLGILACLFVLSVTAPRAWDRMAREETLSQMLAARRPRSTARHHLPLPDRAAREAQSASDTTSDNRTQAPDLSTTPVDLPPQQAVVPPAPEFAQAIRAPLETPPVEPAPADEPADTAGSEANDSPVAQESPLRWPLPQVLLRELGALRDDPGGAWAGEAMGLIRELCQVPSASTRPASAVLADLRELLKQEPAEAAPGSQLEGDVIRARYALTRWVDIWEQAERLDEANTLTATDEDAHARMARCLAQAKELAEHSSSGSLWRDYLQLDALLRLADDDTAVAERRAVARKVLDRLSSNRLTRAQRKFIADGPLAALQTELRSWAAEPVAAARLLAHLDSYERTSLPSDARLVADDWRGLSWSTPEVAEAISQHLDEHYRNANVRLALSSDLINRLVPPPSTSEAPFRDTVVNVPVVGRNTTFTEVRVRLIPDPHRIRVGLEASGRIASDAVASSGPATFHSEGQSTFLVRKLLVLGPEGLSVWPAIAEAENNYNYLISMETNYDSVPLVGSLVRNMARSQHAEKSDEARFEVEEKVAVRARDQFDAEIRPRLLKATESLEKQQITTLRRLGLELVPVSLSTTEDRIVARARLASPQQLGAHTPRPRAPADSAISLQVHQSALNNGLEQLDLGGRSFTLDELFDWIAKKLGRPELSTQEDLPEGVRLTFAKQDAVRVKCDAERIEVLLSFAELTDGIHRWRNFTISTLYRPEPEGLTPLFTRASPISASKGVKNRAVLYAIFSKVLSRSRDIRFFDSKITQDTRLKDLEITQFVIEHGWIGLAYGDKRPGNVARRPQ